jgi:hypothetical protein
MKELCRKTTELFRDYPVLWVPYLCAEVCVFVLSRLELSAARRIATWAITTHSVLGGESQAYKHKTLLFTAPIESAMRFTNVCLITFAFVVTALLTQMILEGRTANTGQAVIVSLHRWQRILWFGVKFCVCMVAGASLGLLTTIPPVMNLCHHLHISICYLTWGLGLVGVIAAAWIISPEGVRLLLPPENKGISAMQKTTARWMGMLAAAASTVLGFLYETFRHDIKVDSSFEGAAVGMIATIAGNAPLLLLFIGLAIVSMSKTEMQEPLSDSPEAEDSVMPEGPPLY